MNAILYASPAPTDPCTAQITRLHHYSSAFGWSIVGEYQGEGLKKQAVRHAQTAQDGVLLVTDLARLGTLPDALAVVRGILKHDSHFVSLAERIDTTTPEGVGALEKLLALADQLPTEIPAVHRPRKRGRAPFGKRHNGDGLVDDADEQNALAVIRELHAKGESLHGICRELDQRGITHRGKPWKGCQGWVKELLERE